MQEKFDNHWVQYRDPIDFINYPSNMKMTYVVIKKGPTTSGPSITNHLTKNINNKCISFNDI